MRRPKLRVLPLPRRNLPRSSPATLNIPPRVVAGSGFRAEWTGPNNPGDYLTIVRPESAAATYQNYRETRDGAPLELTAPIEAGEWEVRYVTVKSKTVFVPGTGQ